MEHSKIWHVEQALRKSIANDLFLKLDIFESKKDLDIAIKIVERKN
jgi:hypothetical protein